VTRAGAAASVRGVAATVRRSGVLGPRPARGIRSLVANVATDGGSLLALASWSASRWPDRPAVVSAGRSVSFRGLVEGAARRSALLAEWLDGATQPCIGLLGRNGIEYVEWLLAGAHHGADIVLLNPLLAHEQLASVARRRPPHLVLCDDQLTSAVLEADLVAAPIAATPDAPGRLGARARLTRVRRRHRATVILMTSGTSGPAQLVAREPSPTAMIAVARSLVDQLDLRAGQPTLLTLPLLHGHGLATLGLTLAMGAPLHLAPSTRGDEVLATIRAHHIAVVVLVPTILHRLVDAAIASGPPPAPSLRTIVSGSAPLPPVLAERTLEHFGPVLHNLYGASETGLVSLATPADLTEDAATVGRALPGTVVTILGPDGEPVPPGTDGRIVVSGPQIARRAGVAVDTGDIGRVDRSGRLTISGRSDDLVIRGGENLFLDQIEGRVRNALDQHQVAELAVVVEPDDGEFGSTLHLFVASAPGAPADAESIGAHLATALPRTIRPTRVTVVDSLPRTLKGDVDRRRLAG
jgi:acyl-CoA synthetase (AMP-forming)/AMP-acid ligase II